ncbi:IS1634 family transposase, partial [Mycoplasma mycoides]|nr:IS1634 family transposase [Mycoplasma mycoides]
MNVNDKTYYCFKSTFAETSQKQAYMNRVNQKGVYDEDKFLEKEDLFGLILFESSDDLNLKDVYI